MGLVYADIELINTGDVTLFNRGYIKETKSEKKRLNALWVAVRI